jgi:hypothetical protein
MPTHDSVRVEFESTRAVGSRLGFVAAASRRKKTPVESRVLAWVGAVPSNWGLPGCS